MEEQDDIVRVSLRLPRELHGRIQEMARADERSLHAQIVWCLRQCEQRARRTRKNVNGRAHEEGVALAAHAAPVPAAPAPGRAQEARHGTD